MNAGAELAVRLTQQVLGCFTPVDLARPQKDKIQVVRSEGSIPRGRKNMAKGVVQVLLENPLDGHGVAHESHAWKGSLGESPESPGCPARLWSRSMRSVLAFTLRL